MMNIRTTNTSKSSRSHFLLIFTIITALVCTMSAYFITSGYLNAFADDEPATDPEVITPETDPNGDISLTVSATGEGTISPEGGTVSVAEGTQYKVYNNELSFDDKTYIATEKAGYTFTGWYLDNSLMDIIGVFPNTANSIEARFSSDATSCVVSGIVKDESGALVESASVRATSDSYPPIIIYANTNGSGMFSFKIPKGSEVYVFSYFGNNHSTAYYDHKLTSSETSGASFDVGTLTLKTVDNENCLLTGAFSAGRVVKDAAIVYLWDDGSGPYHFQNNISYSNDLGHFYCLGKHNTNAYLLYFGPGIRMSARRVNADETKIPQNVFSYNIKDEGVPVYIQPGTNYMYELNLATLDCADVINYTFNGTINLGLENNLSVKFQGDTLTYNMQDDIDPWRTENKINLKYSISVKPENNAVFKQWKVDGVSISDGSVIQINKETIITADVVENVTINGHVKDGAGDIAGADVFFVNNEGTQTYAHSETDDQGKFTWNIPAGITGKVIAVCKGYKKYEASYTSQAGNLDITMQPEEPYVNYYIKGNVREKDGITPIAGALVSYFGKNGTRDYILSGYDGSFLFDLSENREDGILVVSKDYYMTDFIACEWKDLGQWYIEKKVNLISYKEAKTAYLGMSEYQASYDLSLFYNDELIDTTTYTQPFTLYFKDFSIKENGEELFLKNLNGSEELPSGFTYKLTSKSINSNYIFKNWDIKVPNNENAIFESTDIMPIYESNAVDPEVTTKTGDINFLIITALIAIIMTSGTIMIICKKGRKRSR